MIRFLVPVLLFACAAVAQFGATRSWRKDTSAAGWTVTDPISELPEVAWLDGLPWVMRWRIPTGTIVRHRPDCLTYTTKSSIDVAGHHFPVIVVAWPDGSKPEPPAASRDAAEQPVSGAALIAVERQRQIEIEGWTPEHDAHAHHGECALVGAAESYAWAAVIARSYQLTGSKYDPMAALGSPPNQWPWDDKWWKPSADPIRNLVRAGALIAAEIDRLAASPSDPGEAEA